MMAISSKTVLITGASAGFGSFLAQAFAQAGYAVILHGRDKERLLAIKDNIFKITQVECSMVIADLKSLAGIDELKKTITNRTVDILINNAAINPELSDKNAVSDLEGIEDIITTNTSSAIALCYAAFEHFKAAGVGTIININSVAGLRGSSHEVLYAVSKFGLRGFSESVKEDWLKQGVRMIDVYSGALSVGMSANRADMKDLIDPRELAELLVGLCVTKSFFVKELNVRRTAI